MGVVAFGPSWSDDYAIILCPVDISKTVLEQVSKICWDDPMAFNSF
jgi:hypothetical protein